MKKCLKELMIIFIQIFMFYIFPVFSGPTDAMGLVFILILSTFILSIIITIISKNKIKYLYGVLISIIFIPTVYIYYNSSALIHSIWYLVVSYTGTFIGFIFYLILKKIIRRIEWSIKN